MCYLCLANLDVSAVLLQEIATARQTVLSCGFAIYFFGCRNVNHCSDDYDFDFCL
jgi:hypothetical protein